MIRKLAGLLLACALAIPGAACALSTGSKGVAVNVKVDYGAVCDGATNDAAAINRALTYVGGLGGGEVDLPNGNCAYSSTLTVPAYTVLKGQSWSSVLTPKTQNLAVHIQLLGAGSGLQNLKINASAAGVNASGIAIAFDTAAHNPNSEFVRTVFVEGACIGADVNGNSPLIDSSRFDDIQGAGCGGIRVGNGGVVATEPVDVKLFNNSIGGALALANPSDYDLKIVNSGGLMMVANDFLYANYGTWIVPGLNQEVEWTFCDSTALGDTNGNSTTATGYALVIDTSDASAVVKGQNFVGCWASSAFKAGILIQNTGGGTIQGIHFQGQRVYGNGNRGFDLETASMTDFSVDASWICGQALNGVYAVAGLSGGAIRNSTIRGTTGSVPGCDFPNVPGGGPYTPDAILFNGTNANWVITGNDLHGNTGGAILGNPTGASVVANNLGVDDVIPSEAASGTTALGAPNPTWTLTGTSTVSNLTGGWTGRQVRILPTGALPFTTGGNIANALTATSSVPVIAYFDGTNWHLK